MSDPVVKGLKRSSSRPNLRSNSSSASSAKSSTKNRTLSGKSAKPTLMAKRTAAEKAPVRKAAKSKAAPNTKTGTTTAAARPAKSQPAKPAATTKTAPKSAKNSVHASPVKTITPKPAPAKSAPLKNSAPKQSTQRIQRPVALTSHKAAKSAPPLTPRQPTRDEAAALRAFERAHREFSRGNFSEARSLFVALIDQFSGASEVAARARTYLAIAESRLRTDNGLPRDADSLYDRGVIELNRGEYVAAQEMFERALKREPEAAHIHYGLAATRARLGSLELALTSLERALELQPKLRARAQHDLDLTALRNEPDFERLVFSQR